MGTYYDASGNGQFQDLHGTVTSGDKLSSQAPNYSCSLTCTQTYSACGKQIGSFTLTFDFLHSSIGATTVTQVTASEK